MAHPLQSLLAPTRRWSVAPLQVATAITLLVSSVDMPLHILAQPVEPGGPEWRYVATALAAPSARVVYAEEIVPAPGGGQAQAASRPAAAGSVAEARWRLSNGETRAALGDFRALADSGPAESRPEALYWAAYALLQLDERDAAAKALSELHDRYPQSAAANWAVFLLGTAQRKLGQYDAALAGYRAYQAASAVAPFVQSEIAATLFEAGRHREAIDAADAVIALQPGRILTIDARELQAKALAALGDHAGAAARYAAVIDQARTVTYRAEINYRLGVEARAAGSLTTAANAFAAVVTEAPATTWARQALDALDAVAPGAVNSFDRGLVRYRAHRYTEARRLFGQFLDEQTDHPDLPNALFYLAATQEYADDTDLALRNYDALADRYPRSEKSPDALWYAGRLRETAGSADGAARTYSRLAESYPSSVRAGSARFRQGFVRYAARDYAAAVETWSRLATDGPRAPVLTAALYWRARAQRALGDAASAAESMRLAAQAAPYTFHGVRAQLYVSGGAFDGRFRDLSLAVAPRSTPAEDDEALAWLRASQPDAAAFTLDDDPAWAASVELNRLGLTQRAGEQVQELLDRLTGNGPALFQVARALRDEGQFRLSIHAASLAGSAAGRAVAGSPKALRQLLYPAYFAPLALAAGRASGVDPLLLLALIRQESAFDARAWSAADARGLMQVVPSTGQEIASALGVGDYTAADLLQPATSLRFGTYYLKTQLVRYGWSPYRALTAYNAGGGNADRWSAAAGDDEDLFYEAIDFDETRTYLDRIVPNWLAYQDLYR